MPGDSLLDNKFKYLTPLSGKDILYITSLLEQNFNEKMKTFLLLLLLFYFLSDDIFKHTHSNNN